MPEYILHDVCASSVQLEIQDGIIKSIHFTGGCPGNLEALAILLNGLPTQIVIKKLSGIHCGNKPTSCADQLARILSTLT